MISETQKVKARRDHVSRKSLEDWGWRLHQDDWWLARLFEVTKPLDETSLETLDLTSSLSYWHLIVNHHTRSQIMKLEGRDVSICHSKYVPSVIDIGTWHIGTLQEDRWQSYSSMEKELKEGVTRRSWRRSICLKRISFIRQEFLIEL